MVGTDAAAGQSREAAEQGPRRRRHRRCLRGGGGGGGARRGRAGPKGKSGLASLTRVLSFLALQC